VSEITKELLICLVGAHFVGDFYFQTKKDAENKKHPLVLAKHVAIVTALSYLFCGAWQRWEIVAAIFVSHFLIDFTKVSLARGKLYALLIDQIVHMVVLIAIALALPRSGPVILFWKELLGEDYLKLLVILSGMVISVKGGSVIISPAVRGFQQQLDQRRQDLEPGAAGTIYLERRGFENGGRMIGQLERALIFLFIIVGQPVAIGFLIMAKSILRFGEIKDHDNRMEAEYIIIGTLLSFLYAILVAYAARYMLGVV